MQARRRGDLEVDPVGVETGHPWMPHDHPERPFDEATWLCECRACTLAVHGEARHSPFTPLCIKTGYDRVIVSAEYLAETLAAGEPLTSLLYVTDDWVREVFVPIGSWRWKAARTRWWSLMRHEDDDIAGVGHVRHQMARRESAAAVSRRLDYFARAQRRAVEPAVRPRDGTTRSC